MNDNIAYTETYHKKVDSLVVQTLQFCLANLGSNLDYVTILLFVISQIPYFAGLHLSYLI